MKNGQVGMSFGALFIFAKIATNPTSDINRHTPKRMVTVSIHSKLLNMSFALRIIFYFNFEFVTKIFKNKIVKALFVIYK